MIFFYSCYPTPRPAFQKPENEDDHDDEDDWLHRMTLVHQVSDWCSGAAVNFWLDARSEEGEYPRWSLTDERQSSRAKGAQPGGWR